MSNGGDEISKRESLSFSKGNVNEEIASIKPYRFKHFLLHLNIGPFFLAYLAWFLIWISHFGVDEYPELGLIITALIAIMQIVVCLFSRGLQCLKIKTNVFKKPKVPTSHCATRASYWFSS